MTSPWILGRDPGILPRVTPAESLVPHRLQELYEVHEWRHASAVLAQDFSSQWQDIIDVLGQFRLRRSEIVQGGGGLSEVLCQGSWERQLLEGFGRRSSKRMAKWLRACFQ